MPKHTLDFISSILFVMHGLLILMFIMLREQIKGKIDFALIYLNIINY